MLGVGDGETKSGRFLGTTQPRWAVRKGWGNAPGTKRSPRAPVRNVSSVCGCLVVVPASADRDCVCTESAIVAKVVSVSAQRVAAFHSSHGSAAEHLGGSRDRLRGPILGLKNG